MTDRNEIIIKWFMSAYDTPEDHPGFRLLHRLEESRGENGVTLDASDVEDLLDFQERREKAVRGIQWDKRDLRRILDVHETLPGVSLESRSSIRVTLTEDGGDGS